MRKIFKQLCKAALTQKEQVNRERDIRRDNVLLYIRDDIYIYGRWFKSSKVTAHNRVMRKVFILFFLLS